MLEILPQALMELEHINVLLSHERSHVFYKTLPQNLVRKEVYLSTAAVVYITKGQQCIFDPQGREIMVEENSLAFFSRDVYWVSDYIANNEAFEAYLFFMDDAIIRQFITSVYSDASFNPTTLASKDVKPLYTVKADDQIRRYMDSLKAVYADSNSNAHLLSVKLLELLHLIMLQDKDATFLHTLTRYQQVQKCRSIKAFMDEHYLKRLSVSDYALLTGRGVATFVRDFKKVYHTTPHQWLVQRRLEKAHELLTGSAISVADVASQVGYDNVSHFIKRYKNQFGLTPRQDVKQGGA